MFYLTKQLLDTKWEEFKVKKHKLGTYEIGKISLLCFDDKRYRLDDEIHTLAYFHKNSVTGCKEIQKGCDRRKEIEKDCDKKEKIKKDCKKTSW